MDFKVIGISRCPECGARLTFSAVPPPGFLLPCLICTDPLVIRQTETLAPRPRTILPDQASQDGQLLTTAAAPPPWVVLELATIGDLLAAGPAAIAQLGMVQEDLRRRRPFGLWRQPDTIHKELAAPWLFNKP